MSNVSDFDFSGRWNMAHWHPCLHLIYLDARLFPSYNRPSLFDTSQICMSFRDVVLPYVVTIVRIPQTLHLVQPLSPTQKSLGTLGGASLNFWISLHHQRIRTNEPTQRHLALNMLADSQRSCCEASPKRCSFSPDLVVHRLHMLAAPEC